MLVAATANGALGYESGISAPRIGGQWARDCECLPTLTFFQEPDRPMKKKISIRKLLLIR